MIGIAASRLAIPNAISKASKSIVMPNARRNTHSAAASRTQFSDAQKATLPSIRRSNSICSNRSAIRASTTAARSSLTRSLRAIQRTTRSARPEPSIRPNTRAATSTITITPIIATDPYTGLTPRIGIDTRSATHRSRLSTTADPSPTVARAKPASGPVTPDSVINRYPSAELAALPPGTMLDSERVLIWIRNRRPDDRCSPGSPSAAFISGA